MRREKRIIRPEIRAAVRGSNGHVYGISLEGTARPVVVETDSPKPASEVPLHDFLFAEGQFNFEFDGRPASAKVDFDENRPFPYHSEVITTFINWKGEVEKKGNWCSAKTLEDAVDSIPKNIRAVIENARSVQS